ncbi:uncharacterized protein I303_105773 [Kwoniella dejecticola CBS 10117]|uniref:Protein EFR3 n=1 Tax=Kwoniella dejecticola CBS 10117 TaxID=1296121 RepID=A0A1A6A0C6_9TREE|nr:uncharacterized protein I303_05795 [Kwoniella dejecticola CBS 10117]OBR83515.1 hypothetical protein I303_05795 [Kwoniella dejecticola CBS 10117]
MGCIPCTTLQPEVSHLNACYPPSKALLTSGPEYRPLSQDLSKLTYFATNKPSKLAKIGEELEKRIAKESTRSTEGYPKYRASLLISLAILRAVLIECKRDIPLFARSALRSINSALDVKVYQRDEMDLEVIGRASAAFIAFTTFTDGSLIGVEEGITRNYFEILRKFSKMATFSELKEKPDGDKEQQNRTRLIALASLNGAISSDGLYSSQTEFAKQLGILLPPLLVNLFEQSNSNNTMDQIINQTAKIELDHTNTPSPYFSDFSVKRPLNDRRAPSLHAHIPGEKGPSNQDVLYASLKSFKSLIQQSKISQATNIIDKIVDLLDTQGKSWEDLDRCNWLAERLTAWIILQYRFVVPTRLIEILVDDQATNQPNFKTAKQSTILAMVITILNSTISLVGLGVSDLLGNLITLIIRRIKLDERDVLLPALVSCVSALGTHIYYADQINDIIEEISIRIAELSPSDKNRSEIIRVLTNCIIGVMVTTDQGDQEADYKINNVGIGTDGTPSGSTNTPTSNDKGKSKSAAPPSAVSTPQTENAPQRIHHKSSRRNPISPEVWQETLPLLCEATYSVRITYARALLLFIQTEFPRSSSAKSFKATQNDSGLYRFLNALNASVYTLLISNCLGVGVGEIPSPLVGATSTLPSPVPDAHPSTVPDNSTAHENGANAVRDHTPGERNGSISNKEKGVSFNLISPTPLNQSTDQSQLPTPTEGTTSGNGSGTVTPNKKRQPRRPSLPLNRLQSNQNISFFDQVATPNDFSIILRILLEIYTEILPAQLILVGIPMLLALDRDSGNDLIRRSHDGKNASWVIERKKAIRELVCYIFRAIGEKWAIGNVQDIAQKSLTSLAEPYLIPPYQAPTPTANLELPEQATSFVPINIEGESSSSSKPLMDPEFLLSNLSESPAVQGATNRDALNLRRRWETKWNVEGAIKDSIERYASAHVKPDDHEKHHEIANVLMSMNNGSYQSFGNGNGTGSGRPGSRSIDIGDLREALGGKVVDDLTTTTSSPPSIISSSYLTQEDQVNLTNAIQKSLSQRGQNRTLSVNNNPDVKEVLKDIFKDKKRASSGAGAGAGAGMHAHPHAHPQAHRIRTVSASSGLGRTSSAKVPTGNENGIGTRDENVNGNGNGHGASVGTTDSRQTIHGDDGKNGDVEVVHAGENKKMNGTGPVLELGKVLA